jgi:hypothetical protein
MSEALGSILALQNKIETELLYDPIIPLLGIYPKEMDSTCQRDNCTPMFLAVLLTIVKTWQQPKYLLTDE